MPPIYLKNKKELTKRKKNTKGITTHLTTNRQTLSERWDTDEMNFQLHPASVSKSRALFTGPTNLFFGQNFH